MAPIASSTRLPMLGWGAFAFRCGQRASFGTQKMLAARYSSGSSGLAPCAFWPSSSACFASKASEMYLRKIKPRTTCLYSAASMLLRRASAAAQSFASRPMVALSALLAGCVVFVLPPLALRAIRFDPPGGGSPRNWALSDGSVRVLSGHTAAALGHEGGILRACGFGSPTPDRSHAARCARATLLAPRAALCSL